MLQKKTHALGERVKELKCLYAMSNLVERYGVSLENVLAKAVDIIAPAWQYPEITCVRITLKSQSFMTLDFQESLWRQSSPIVVKGKKIGSLDVFYQELKPPCDEGPFLREERSLINMIAKRIGEIIERKAAEDALKESMSRNKALLSAIPAIIFRIRRDGTILDVKRGKGFQRKRGARRLVDRNVYDLPLIYSALPMDAVYRAMAQAFRVIETGETLIYEERIAGTDGLCHYEVLLTSSGKDDVLGIIRDNTAQRRLERQVLEISEWEQQRIGQDLHDSLCQQLAGIGFLGKVLQQRLAAESVVEAGDAGEIVSLIDEAITQTKGLSRGLYPVRLQANGLMTGLSELAKQVKRLFGITCRFECKHPVLIHDNTMAIHLYRIAQEAVNNAIKHGKARLILISISGDNGETILTVRNDGLGFRRISKKTKGMGISIMKHRAALIGASLNIRSDDEEGTVVTCSFHNKKRTGRRGKSDEEGSHHRKQEI